MRSTSTADAVRLSRRYAAVLRKRLARKPGASLRAAQKLGREALAAGLDTLDVAKLHGRALVALKLPAPTYGNRDGLVRRAASFLLEALVPIGKAHRATLKHNGRLRRVNGHMRKRAVGLAATSRMLKREIGRRKALQEALRSSEQHYGQLVEKSRRMQEHLRHLSHEILSAHEAERKKISRELHDEIGQTLTAINVKLATLRKEAKSNTTGLTKKIASTQRLVERSMNKVHRFARELRPSLLDDLGLIPALHSYMKEFTKRTHIRIHFKAFAEVERMDSDKRTVLFRVAQEALTNVAKHAEASLVDVRVERLGGAVHMEIHDNGKSFQVQRVFLAKRIRRLGLLGMRERVEMVGGTFAVESAKGKGTTIHAHIPFRSGR